IIREFEVTENNFFVKAGAQLCEEPDAKAWERVKRMSVMKNNIKVLKETPKCPNLRTLFLGQNELKVISNGIDELPIELKSLTKLKLSDLSGMRNLRKIPQHLISNFFKLQIFRMWLLQNRDYPNEDNVSNGDNEKLIEELKGLQCSNILATLSKVTIIGCNKLRDMTWLVLAPNLKTLSIIACAKMGEIL
ncbi:hypothetical protein Goari_005255, partial [Gossypium aridum]|nr:hypothetical protein [Gossypium aridum]